MDDEVIDFDFVLLNNILRDQFSCTSDLQEKQLFSNLDQTETKLLPTSTFTKLLEIDEDIRPDYSQRVLLHRFSKKGDGLLEVDQSNYGSHNVSAANSFSARSEVETPLLNTDGIIQNYRTVS